MNFEEYGELHAQIKAPAALKARTLSQMKQGLRKRSGPHVFRIVVIAVLAFALLSISVFSFTMFLPTDSDQLSLSAVYDGNGVVNVTVENGSEKPLEFQSQLRLMRWSTGKEIAPLENGKLRMEGRKIPAHSTGALRIDLSKAYDIAMLEEPLPEGDHYYLVLTNNDFQPGHDWHCSVSFAEEPPVSQSASSGGASSDSDALKAPKPDSAVLSGVHESLKFYFEGEGFSSYREYQQYAAAYTKLIDALDGRVIAPVIPEDLTLNVKKETVFDDSVSAEEQDFTWGSYYQGHDPRNRLIAREWERALAIQAFLPDKTDEQISHAIPLYYLMFYEKSDIASQKDYAFLYGGLYTFEELAPKKVYEDDRYVCYDITSLILPADPDSYIAEMVELQPDAVYNEQIDKRIRNIHRYFAEHLSESFRYRDSNN